MPIRIVIDTNVLVAAVRSRTGAGHRLIRLLPHPQIITCLSVPLHQEWMDVLTRPEHLARNRQPADAVEFVRALTLNCELCEVFFKLPEQLPDPEDDKVLEAAVNARASHIITYNLADFRGCEKHGVTVIRPGELFRLLETNA